MEVGRLREAVVGIGAAQVDTLAERLEREGVTVHRPERLPLFVRDTLIVLGEHMVEASLRQPLRQQERFGLRVIVQRLVIERSLRWSCVPPGWPNMVDGPFLEGGDVLVNDGQIYVGMSGQASDMAGIDWLQALLSPGQRVIPVALRSSVRHLEDALTLVKPGLLLWCPQRLIDGLPTALRNWDKIEVSADEAERLATNVLVLDEGRVLTHAGNERVIGELQKRAIEVISLPFDGPIGLGGGVRSACLPLC